MPTVGISLLNQGFFTVLKKVRDKTKDFVKFQGFQGFLGILGIF